MSKELLQDIIKEFSPDKFIRFFREKNRSFAPRTEDLSHYNDDNFSNGTKLGEMQFAQDEKMLICVFEASQPLSERSGKKAQYEKGKRILKDTNADAGIFIFYSNSPLKRGVRGVSSFRFSLIYPEYTGIKRQWSYFKRFTYFVSPELTNKTFLQQIGVGDFSSLQKIKEAFSVDPVTKQFYNELQSWYFWAMDKINFPDDYKHSDDPAKDKEIRNATNLIRLITRIIFIWFLMEKGLVPPELFLREKLAEIVRDFMKASNFYNAVLQNLFFGTLNQKMNERKFADDKGYPANKKEYGVKNLFRYADKFLISKNEVLALFKNIPFLNGGLFDCLDKEDESGKVIYIDGFSRNPAKQAIIPDHLFFQHAEEKVDLSCYGLGTNRIVRGLIEILNSYNFTIDENTPVDQEIALDPELLGKVFENLLASYNPETATTARKATGSYYTPREIVDYMVQESLVEYLKNSPSKKGCQEFPSERGVDAGSGRGVSDVVVKWYELPYNPKLKERARELRKAGNLSEVLFWNQIKNRQFLGLDFDRQKIIGNYIVDFYCKKLGLIIEIDGSSHNEKFEYDIERDKYFESLGLKVIHILDKDIKINIEGVMQFLEEEVITKHPVPLGHPSKRGEWEEKLRQLLSYSDEVPEFSESERQTIISAIDNIKILDPACGSGAFPMGILHKLVYALQKLDPDNKHWHELQYQKALKETEEVFKQGDKNQRQERLKEINEAFNEGINYPDYARKLYLIENCIYGVDIQPIAIQISKLRFFISLVLDQKVDREKENLGIRALPNLETKFVAANTLIGLDKPQQLALRNLDIEKKENELKALRHKYFTANTRSEKLRYQKQDKKLREEIAKLLINDGWKDATAKKIAAFDLYDQNASADFFDPEWMFGINNPAPLAGEGQGEGGFDVVIGNPPYIRQEDLKLIKPILEKQGFQVYNSTSDIYTYFYEKGWQVLNPQGHLTFITSNKWMRAKYGEKLRKFFKEKTLLKQIIDFGGHKVFESATVDTNILIFQKSPLNKGGEGVVSHSRTPSCHSRKSGNPVKILSIKSDFSSGVDLSEYFRQNAITMKQSDLDEKCFTFGDDAVMKLKAKIEKAGVPLRDWDVKIYRGIITGFNEAFIIDNETKERLCKEDPKSIEILKPILRGRDIQRYSYKWAGLWVVATFPTKRLDINDYPAVKRHLLSFGKERLEQSGNKGARKKTGNKWFETQDNIAYYEEFEKEKIVWQRVTKTSMFCFVDRGIYIHDSMAFLTTKNSKYLLALLNSKVVNKYFETIAHQYGNTGFLCSNQYVEQLPIPKIPDSAQKPFITLVDQILAAKKQHTPQSPLDRGEFKDADTSALEQQIDEMVYALYGLTPEEIAIVEGKG